jgi:hypothetical protein
MPADHIPEHKCASVPQFLQIILPNYWADLGWVFRGQDNIDWPLRPKAGRPEFYLQATQVWVERGQSSGDLGRFTLWRKQAVAYTDTLPVNDFECLAFAQHYGLATRLLDWSTNPLVALYFAVEMEGKTDSAVFCHMPWFIVDQNNSSIDRQFDRVVLLKPRPFDRRIAAQGGVFTFHIHPDTPLTPMQVDREQKEAAAEGVDLVAIRIPAQFKPMLLRQLDAIGINRKYLFPDLEGLSTSVNWETNRSVRNRGAAEGPKA